jgi:prevent-host-death family protein
MKDKRRSKLVPTLEGKPWLVSEAAAAAVERPEVSVREAKDNLSSLLERAANGEDIVVTSDGAPRAMIVRYRPRITGRPFKPNLAMLRAMPMTSDSTELIRRMRDDGF